MSTIQSDIADALRPQASRGICNVRPEIRPKGIIHLLIPERHRYYWDLYGAPFMPLRRG